MLAVDDVLSPAEPTGWWERRGRAMGSTVHVLGHGGPADAADRALRRIEELEACWSRFVPDGELRRLNDDPRPEVPVSPTLAAALGRAVLAWDLTGGRFDPTVLDALESAGYDRDFADVAERTVAPLRGRPVPGGGDVSVAAGVVRRPPGLRLDLGGVGKGLAADLVATGLLEMGVGSVAVALGGDVRVAGTAPRGGWRVPVADPFDDASPLMTVTLDGGGIVTSTTRVRRWQTSDGGWAHHLIDPRTGRPAEQGVSAVVAVAEDAWWAEAVAKAALVAGPDDGAALLRMLGVEAWLVADDTSVTHVPRAREAVPA